MWRPKIRRQGRSRTRAGLEYAFSDGYLDWKAPRGVHHPNRREIARVLDSIPAGLDWDWAQDRVVPILERPGVEPFPQNPNLVAVADCGIGYGFGIDSGALFARVTRSLAELWDRDETVIRDVAFANLRRRLHDDAPAFEVPDDAGEAIVVRALTTPEGFATSVLLVPDALLRIFGECDLVFTAPSRSLLLAFPIDVPPESVDQLTTDAERLDPHPLRLDPFRLRAGRLTWDGVAAHSS